jgi:hypothetical protein
MPEIKQMMETFTRTTKEKYIRRQRSGGSRFEASPGKYFMRPYLKKTYHKEWAGRVAQSVGPEFKSQYHQKKKKEKNKP